MASFVAPEWFSGANAGAMRLIFNSNDFSTQVFGPG